MAKSKKTVVVGMSGGVDSSVTACLLKQQGYDVIGMFMKNWEEKDEHGMCKSSFDADDASLVCSQLDIPFYAVNFAKEYKESVFSEFLKEIELGFTPNPDILCNKEIKFKVLLQKAIDLGADYLATGHYARNENGRLFKGSDPGKDQSYFLYTLKESILEKVLFPIGGMLKKEVRKVAKENGLATSEKKDSTGICFIGERNFKEFLQNYLAKTVGDFETLDGKVVGRHDGTCYYTIGQRRGLGIGGPGEPWFVSGKDVLRNVVFVVQGEKHPALYFDELVAANLEFVSPDEKMAFPYFCKSKIRYRQDDQDCIIEKIESGKAFVRFKQPQRAVTPRQSIVFYDGERCLGGGVIEASGPSYYEMGKILGRDVN